MIRGVVNARRQPIIALTIRGPSGQEVSVDALLDTGHNGALMLPPEQVETLGLRFIRTDTANVADGRRVPVPVYAARVVWDGMERTTSVIAAGSQPILGMSLTLGHKITVEMVDGGVVAVERL